MSKDSITYNVKDANAYTPKYSVSSDTSFNAVLGFPVDEELNSATNIPRIANTIDVTLNMNSIILSLTSLVLIDIVCD